MEVTVKYIRETLVRLTLTYGPRQISLVRRTDDRGLLKMGILIPLMPLPAGHGEAHLRVTALTTPQASSAQAPVQLSNMVLSIHGSEIHGCAQTVTAHVAYIANARVQYLFNVDGHRQAVTEIQTDHDGHAPDQLFTVGRLTSGADPVKVTLVAVGQRGSIHQAESASIVESVPRSCRRV